MATGEDWSERLRPDRNYGLVSTFESFHNSIWFVEPNGESGANWRVSDVVLELIVELQPHWANGLAGGALRLSTLDLAFVM